MCARLLLLLFSVRELQKLHAERLKVSFTDDTRQGQEQRIDATTNEINSVRWTQQQQWQPRATGRSGCKCSTVCSHCRLPMLAVAVAGCVRAVQLLRRGEANVKLISSVGNDGTLSSQERVSGEHAMERGP